MLLLIIYGFDDGDGEERWGVEEEIKQEKHPSFLQTFSDGIRKIISSKAISRIIEREREDK